MPAKKPAGPTAGTTVEIAPSDLRLYTRNPRKGNVGAVAASLKAHGQYRPVVVNIGTHTGRKFEVLAGNHTVKAIRSLAQKNANDERWSAVLCHLVDVDDDQAARIVLADNKTSENGQYDNAELAGLLDEVRESDGGLGATGFTLDDLDGLTQTDPDIPEEAYRDIDDEDPAPETGGRGTPTIAYSIVFDTAEQKKQWVEFMNWLKRSMPECTVGERVANYIDDQADAAVDDTEES